MKTMNPSAFVDIWIIPLTLELPTTLPLSEMEWIRAWQYDPVPRRKFIVSRYAARCILASYLHISPERIAFQLNAFGKPSLADTSSGLQFNVSHSEHIALCGVTRSGQIGVDVEFIRPIQPFDEMDVLARLYFADQEYRQYSRLPVSEQTEAFFALWTRKEAYIKGIGHGLAHPLNDFCVPFDGPALNRRMAIVDAKTDADLGWSLFAFQPAAQYAAAIAIEGYFSDYPTFKHFAP